MGESDVWKTRKDLTPPQISAWCVWNGAERALSHGSGVPATPPLERAPGHRVVCRYVGTEFATGAEFRVELHLDRREGGDWGLWRAAVDDHDRETGFVEQLAWCHWPNGSPDEVVHFLITAQRVAFQRGLTDVELSASEVLQEHCPGVSDLLIGDGDGPSDDEE